jgi:hypothetical protein
VRVSFLTQVQLEIGDELWLEFPTHNTIYQIWDNYLGFTAADLTFGVKSLGCLELSLNLISDTRMNCYLIPGNQASTPALSAFIKVPILKQILVNNLVQFWIPEILLPTYMSLSFKYGSY